jgi:hypothetical protein
MPAIYPDKRKRHDWRAAAVKAGTRFRVQTWAPGSDHELQEVWTGDHSRYSIVTAMPEHADFLAALVLVENETPSQWLDRVNNGYGAERVLDQLFKDGVITLEQVISADERATVE